MKKNVKMVLEGYEVERLPEHPKYNWMIRTKGLDKFFITFREVCQFIYKQK